MSLACFAATLSLLKFEHSVTEIKSDWMPTLYVVYCQYVLGTFLSKNEA